MPSLPKDCLNWYYSLVRIHLPPTAPVTDLTVAWADDPTTLWPPTRVSPGKLLHPEDDSHELPYTKPVSGEEASSSLPAAGLDYPWP